MSTSALCYLKPRRRNHNRLFSSAFLKLCRNMPFLPRITPLIPRSIQNIVAVTARPMHTNQGVVPPQTDDLFVTNICDSLRKGINWNTLSRRFNLIELNDTSSVIEKVLLELKEPPYAKCALGFFHWSAQPRPQRMHFKHLTSTYCITIHILVRAKLIKDARALLESVLSSRSSIFSVVDSLLCSYKITNSIPFVFDLLIQTCSKLRMLDDALDVCRYLDGQGFKLSIITYNTLLHVFQKSDQTALVWQIYEHMIEKRTYPNEVTTRIMVAALSKEGKLQKFIDIVDRIHGKRCSPGVVANTCLIIRMMEEGRIEQVLLLLKRMLQKNMILDTISYSLIVHARVHLGNIESAWEVYEEMLKRGFRGNSYIYTLFIKAHCEERRIEEAIGLVKEMEDVGLKLYNETFHHLIVGCSQVGRMEESLKWFEKMIEMGFVPSCLAFNQMVERFCENGDTKHADVMLTLLLDKGFVPDEITYSHLIAGYGKEGDFQGVLKLYYEMEYKSLSLGSLAFSSLIMSLCQCNKLEEAYKYLAVMKDRSLTPSSYVYEALEKGDKTRAHLLHSEL